MRWLRQLTRLSWYNKPEIKRSKCGFCRGYGLTHLDGTPAHPGESNPNIGACGNCAGSGLVFGGRVA
jgi:hypothetical protein